MGLKNDFKSTTYGIMGKNQQNIVIVNNLTKAHCIK